jgi:uncharacterized protein (DUF4213/DUF364 family)
MVLSDELIDAVSDGVIVDVRIGLNWTAVVAEVEGELQCGLASTIGGHHNHGGEPTIPWAGELIGRSALDLAAWIMQDNQTRRSLGMATINALLPRHSDHWTDCNAEEVIASYGANVPVVLVGHFPFVPSLKERLPYFSVIERRPVEGDYPEAAAHQLIPQAAVVALTSMTLLNGSFEGLIQMCSPDAVVMLLGPSTPLSPVIFDHQVDILAGSIVTDIDAVLRTVSQGGNFRQVHRAGVRLVALLRPELQ